MRRKDTQPAGVPWRDRIHAVIFEAETPSGKAFDVALLVCIIASVVAVLLESVDEIRTRFGHVLLAIEWCFTLLFTVEYVLRLVCVRRPARYALSFFGIVDLAAIVPTYLSLFVTGTHSLIVVRAFRLLRVFRVFKLLPFVGEANQLQRALKNSMPKITVFLGVILALVLLMGSLMYVVEGADNGFTSIPMGMYWAIVTMTTVGYGDISPSTDFGRFLAAILMVMGYAIIAVPTGIVSSEMMQVRSAPTRTCSHCLVEGHEAEARYCRMCGGELASPSEP